MRVTIVSTSKLRSYRIIALSIVSVFLLFVIGSSVYRMIFEHVFRDVFILFVWIYFGYKAICVILKIKSVSYDDSAVYYYRKGFEVQIPFEDIKSVEIKTLSGIYKINLFRPSQDGTAILFKTSLWYPINFKRQDDKVNKLRTKIDTYKKRIRLDNKAQLPSYYIPIE